MGNVLQAGVGQAPARQAAIFAGLPETTPCCHPEQGVRLGPQGGHLRRAGDRARRRGRGGRGRHGVDVATRPYFDRTRCAAARGWATSSSMDAMIHDGLWDVYNQQHMGMCAEAVRDDAGHLAAPPRTSSRSSPPAAPSSAQKDGAFKAEIVPVEPQKKGEPMTVVAEDEGPKNAKPDKIPSLKPVFKKDGTVTAANASSINDGARGAGADERRAREGARAGRSSAGSPATRGAARKPVEFTIAPADAIKKLLEQGEARDEATSTSGRSTRRSRWCRSRNNQLLKLDPAKSERARRRGGARPPHRRVRRAHPRDAAARDEGPGKKRGVASLCIGGGEGIALMVER